MKMPKQPNKPRVRPRMPIETGKRYKILLTRQDECGGVIKPNSNTPPENSTLGMLEVIDLEKKTIIFKCYTCENGGESTDIANKDKRIVARDYNIEWTDSSKNSTLAKKYPKFKCANGRNKAILITCDSVMLSFRDRRILIHIGNYPQDTLGCILLGKTKSLQNGWVSNSIECVKEFYELIEKIGVENCFLRILEI